METLFFVVGLLLHELLTYNFTISVFYVSYTLLINVCCHGHGHNSLQSKSKLKMKCFVEKQMIRKILYDSFVVVMSLLWSNAIYYYLH